MHVTWLLCGRDVSTDICVTLLKIMCNLRFRMAATLHTVRHLQARALVAQGKQSSSLTSLPPSIPVLPGRVSGLEEARARSSTPSATAYSQ